MFVIRKVVIKIRFKEIKKKENRLLEFFGNLILFWLAIIIISEIQNVREIKIVDIESCVI